MLFYPPSVKEARVTSRQSLALSAVVADVHDIERLKAFTKIVVNDAGKFGTILTVHRFEGRLTWHVSVTALSDQFKPILWEELKPSQRESVRQLAHELLDDVGRPDSDFEDVQDKSYQIIRQLTIERGETRQKDLSQNMIAGCEGCSEIAEIPFDNILDSSDRFRSERDGLCFRSADQMFVCGAGINEKTLVDLA